jgi:hypothetical protein
MERRLRAIAARAGGPCLICALLLATGCGSGIPADATNALPPSKFRPAPKDDAKLPDARALTLQAGDLRGAVTLPEQSGEPTIDELADGETPETRDLIAANWQNGYRSAFGTRESVVVSELDLFRTSAPRLFDAFVTDGIEGLDAEGSPTAFIPGGFRFQGTAKSKGKRMAFTAIAWRRGPGIAIVMVGGAKPQPALAESLARRQDARMQTALAGL